MAASSTVSVVAGFIFWSIGFMDARHASAMDVANMAKMMAASEIARLEYSIEDTERKMLRIQRIPTQDRNPDQNGELEDLRYKKEFLLRQLERLDKGDD